MVFVFEDFELDLERFQLRCRGEVRHLEPQVFDVLAYLVQNHERLVPKQELLDHIWPEHYVTEAALNSRLMAARKAIGDSGRQQRLIKTVHGRGFHFIGAVSETGDSQPETLLQAPQEVLDRPVPDQVLTTAVRTVQAFQAPTTTFVGRAAELSQLASLLNTPACRLLTVVGPGGVGKTRLVLEAAGRAQAGGTPVAYVSLEGVRNAADIPARIAAAAGIVLQGADTVAELTGRLGDRELLVILDNFEQLAGESADVLLQVLHQNPRVRLFLTSRVVLGLREEWLFSATGLSLEADEQGLSDAVRLFLDRARQAGASIDPSDKVAVGVIARIAKMVDGMPLALELAAAHTRFMPVESIATHLGRDLDVLQVDIRNIPARHQSIPGLLEESYRYLSVEQMRGLLSLSVFEGSFSAAAAAEVADAPLRVLAALVDQSLVQPREGRFSLHPLLRQFARERLGGSFTELQERHARYFCELVAARCDALEQRYQVETSLELDPEIENIIAGWRWAASEHRADLLSAAAYPLGLYLQYRSRLIEASELYELAVPVLEAGGETYQLDLASMLTQLGWAYLRSGRGGLAPAVLRRAREIFDRCDADPGQGIGRDPVTAEALIAWSAGDYAAAEALSLEASRSAHLREDPLGEALALFFAGSLLLRQAELVWLEPDGNGSGDYVPAPNSSGAIDEAKRRLDGAASILEDHGERWLRALVEIARAGHIPGTRAEKAVRFERAAILAKEFGNASGRASTLVSFADFLVDSSDVERAEEALAEARRLHAHLGDPTGIAEVERCSGRARVAAGDFAGAIAHARASLDLSVRLRFANNVPANFFITADVLAAIGQLADAAELYRYIAAHPVTTAFSRAKARFKLAAIREIPGDAGGLSRPWSDLAGHELYEAASIVRKRMESLLTELATPPEAP